MSGWGSYGMAPVADPTPIPDAPATGPLWCELPIDHIGECHRVTVAVLLQKARDGDLERAKLCGRGENGWRATRLVPTMRKR